MNDRKVVDLERLAANGTLKIMVSDKGGNLTNLRPYVLQVLGVGSDLVKANQRGNCYYTDDSQELLKNLS